jgi:hypothetical protein
MGELSIEDRVRALEDRLALDDIVKRYFLASDDDDGAALAALFDQDAEFLISGGLCAKSPAGIAEFVATERQKMGLTNHVLDSALFEFAAPDRATGIVCAHLELVYSGVAVLGGVRYLDTYVRRSAGWKLQRRDLRVRYLAPWNELAVALTSPTPVRWPGLEHLPTDVLQRKKHAG